LIPKYQIPLTGNKPLGPRRRKQEAGKWILVIISFIRFPLCCADRYIKQLAHPELQGKPIIGGKDCEGVTQTPKNGEGFKIGDIAVKALYTPCHTQDSICWFMEDKTGKVVFTGDTLFHGGLLPNRTPRPVFCY
jgi:glyoxylase-like metal-dependent hydrolase (beta-lactamase superfamily II)